jgi:hypothetical protein
MFGSLFDKSQKRHTIKKKKTNAYPNIPKVYKIKEDIYDPISPPMLLIG